MQATIKRIAFSVLAAVVASLMIAALNRDVSRIIR